MVLDSDDVQGFLTTLSQHAADQLSGRDHEVRCGITLLRPRAAETVASSDNLARTMDEVQYQFDEGPCLTAARTGQITQVHDVTSDSRWPQYLQAIAETGVRSILAVPIPLEGDSRCALNLYSPSTRAFTDEAVRDAERFAQETSVTLRLAVRIAQLTDAQGHLKEAMRSRTIIDLAAVVGSVSDQPPTSTIRAIRRAHHSFQHSLRWRTSEIAVRSPSNSSREEGGLTSGCGCGLCPRSHS
ncbi:GAF domain-containing protein [Arthrobacter cheniae]